MSDLDFKKNVWMADASKSEKLRIILRDPVFSEAVELALAMNPPVIGTGPTAIQDTALDGARFSGMTQLLSRLRDVSHMEVKEPEKPKPRPIPFSHITKERSAFSPPAKESEKPTTT